MRDSRVTIFNSTPLTVSTATTTNGATLDLKSGYVGDYFEGSPEGYGVGIKVLFTSITGTNNNVVLKWQVSDNGSTWVDGDTVLAGELSALVAGGTKIEVPTRFEHVRRYARLVLVTTTMTTSSFVLNAWLSDGTTDQAYGQTYLVK